MQEYIFLFVLAFIWIIFAVVQDLKTREISNWLNFSLIAFVLVYRAFYSIYFEEPTFFVFGLVGIFLFVGLGYLFYYSKVFAGGDAKLLFGLGGVLPYEILGDFVTFGVGFIFVLFFGGMIYSLIYSSYLVGKKRKKFWKDFSERITESKNFIFIFIGIVGVLFLSSYFVGFGIESFAFLFLLLIPLFYVYSKSVEEVCMIKWISPENLTEGDWLEKDVKVGKKWIKKSVHGLDFEEIKILKKYKKKVLIKEGIPFSPAFLIAFLTMVFYALT